MNIVIGTSNPGKIREIASILMPMGYKLIPQSLDIEEIGDTIQENADIKALGYSKNNPDEYVIAEDSGLVVKNLNGLPGPYSSRFHTITFDENLKAVDIPHETFTTDKTKIDKLNNKRLLELVKEKIPDMIDREAYFEVCFVVVKNGEILKRVTEVAHGYIINEMKGENGFGYDPLFVGIDTYGKTYAELDNARKNLRSHRKKALQKLGLWIAQNIPTHE